MLPRPPPWRLERSATFACTAVSGRDLGDITMEPAGWLSPSGGIVWHLRALRFRGHWTAFISDIGEWLDTWRHGCSGLLLLGPSAGWCLTDRFLSGFPRIHAVEMDPVAPFAFDLLHGRALRRSGSRITWQHADLFVELERLLDAYPDYAILFSNVLGQHALHRGETGRAQAELESLRQRLAGRRWASFHDRLSGAWPRARPIPAVIRLAAAEGAEALARRVAVPGVWYDHLTTNVLPANCTRLILPWMIRPARLHWIEAGYVV